MCKRHILNYQLNHAQKITTLKKKCNYSTPFRCYSASLVGNPGTLDREQYVTEFQVGNVRKFDLMHACT